MLDKKGKVSYNNTQSFTDEIKQVRRRLGWSQTKLGKECHLSARTIRNIESGLHQPSPANRETLEEWLLIFKGGERLARESLQTYDHFPRNS